MSACGAPGGRARSSRQPTAVKSASDPSPSFAAAELIQLTRLARSEPATAGAPAARGAAASWASSSAARRSSRPSGAPAPRAPAPKSPADAASSRPSSSSTEASEAWELVALAPALSGASVAAGEAVAHAALFSWAMIPPLEPSAAPASRLMG
ncbi:MAG: hypothetical protein J3K34DRAFT_430680 [Monoraphidium minutum]|nr:MAG: hypothetical protein J3K34DRAFT_430680 [Monoraphidium minutum]